VVPDTAALGQEGIDFATNELDRRNGSRRCPSRTRWQTSSGLVVHSAKQGIGERRRRTDLKAPRLGLLPRPGRLEGTATSGRPPTAPQCRRGDERDLRGPVNVESNLNSPVRITPTKEGCAIDWIEDPNPIGLAESTEFLARNASSGRASDNVSRSKCSTAPSASVTGVPSTFNVTETPDSKCASASSAARAELSNASWRSSARSIAVTLATKPRPRSAVGLANCDSQRRRLTLRCCPCRRARPSTPMPSSTRDSW
jgi:hypothetical protein